MKADGFEKWLKNIFNTQEHEISCSQCFDLVSRYVDLELAGKDVEHELYEVGQHLGQCPACRQEYEALRDLRSLEEQGNLPDMDELMS